MRHLLGIQAEGRERRDLSMGCFSFTGIYYPMLPSGLPTSLGKTFLNALNSFLCHLKLGLCYRPSFLPSLKGKVWHVTGAGILDIGGEFLLSCCMCREGKPVRAFLLLLITVTAVISFTIMAPTSLTNTRANFSSSQHPAKHCSVSIQQSRFSDGPCSHHSLQTALQLKALHRQAA